MRRAPSISDSVGLVVGAVASPFFAVTSALRRARTFHPRGDCALGVAHVAAIVEKDVATLHNGDARMIEELAARLEGPVFVRFSDALTKRKARWPDVLGCAIRFGGREGDQDLLLATIKRPWTMPFSPLTTHVENYLANDYFAVSPFEVSSKSAQRIYFRLHPTSMRRRHRSKSRGPKQRRSLLDKAVTEKTAMLDLGISTSPWGPFSSVCRIDLTAVHDDNDTSLRFDPFRAGRGVTPVGFVHSIRRSVYSLSQRARLLV